MSHLYRDGTVILDPEKLRNDATCRALSMRGSIQIRNLELEDVVNELILAAYEAVARYDPEKATVNTYISRILDYRLLELQTKSYKDRHVVFGVDTDPTTPHDPWRDLELVLACKEVMALLSEELQQFAQLLMVYQPREVLAIPGMNRRRYYKNVQALREAFRRHGVKP